MKTMIVWYLITMSPGHIQSDYLSPPLPSHAECLKVLHQIKNNQSMTCI